MSIRLAFLGLVGTIVVGCAASGQSEAMRRHAGQFHCSEGQLTAKEISANVYLVTGCGPEATYVCSLVKSGAGMERTCILDSIKEDGVTKTSR